MKQFKVFAVAVAMTAMSVSVMAQTSHTPVAPQMMTAEQAKVMIDQQRTAFEKHAEQQKAFADAQKVHFESMMKAQEIAQKKQMQAMIDHMEALRLRFDTMAEKARAVLDAHHEAQQRQMYGYMLGMLPEGEIKNAFKSAEEKRVQILQDMKVKHQAMKQKMEAARKEARARMLKAVNAEA